MKVIVSASLRILFIIKVCSLETLAAYKEPCTGYCGWGCSESEVQVWRKCDNIWEICCEEKPCANYGGICRNQIYHCELTEVDVKGVACPDRTHCCKRPPQGTQFRTGYSYYKSIKGKLVFVPYNKASCNAGPVNCLAPENSTDSPVYLDGY